MNNLKTQKPKITAKNPIKVTLKKGQRYAYCTCGYSAKSPFCDNAHREDAPEYRSLKFCAIENGDARLCQCKQTKTPPFCDESHNNL